MLWLHCNHTGREFITGSWVNNGSFRIQLTKENKLHQLPRPRPRWQKIISARCGRCLREQCLTSTPCPSTNHTGWVPFDVDAARMQSLLVGGERGRRKGVKHEFIWRSFRLLINRNPSDVILLWHSGSSFEIWFDSRTGCAERKTFTKVTEFIRAFSLKTAAFCCWKKKS